MTQTQTAPGMTSVMERASDRVDSLDLEPIVYKLMHPEPGQMVMSLAEADQQVSVYRSWLKLCAWYPAEPIVPSKPVDEVWHLHLLDTGKWAEDSEQAFGFVMHHFPYFGLRGPDDEAALHAAYDRTRDLFRQHFGVDLGQGEQSCSTSCQAGTGGGSQCSSSGCHNAAALAGERPRPARTAVAAGI